MKHARGWVLVVDDDDDIRDIVAIVLGQFGYGAVGAADGLDALARLRLEDRPSLILLDLMMPRLSGADLLKTLSADPVLSRVPVVVMSGDGAAGATAEALGAKGLLTKPMDIEELVSTVERFASEPAQT